MASMARNAAGWLLLLLLCGAANAAEEEVKTTDDLKGFSDLDWQGWAVIGIIAGSFVIMILGLCTPALTMLGEVILFMVLGILSVSEALEGFSSTSVWTVAVMFVVAQGIAGTGGLDFLMSKVLGCPSDITLGQIRVMAVTLVLSSFVSDTPITAIMIPVAIAFAQKARLPQKQLLILVGFSALCGGTNTVIGTSTNLAITGQMDARYGDEESPYYRADYTGITTFGITPYGLPGSIWLVIFCTLLSPLFLTGGQGFFKWINYFRVGAVDKLWQDSRSFDVSLRVEAESPVVGMTVDETGMMGLVYIMPVSIRSGASEQAVTPDYIIKEGDIITFAGDLTKLPELVLSYNMHPVDDDMTSMMRVVMDDEFPADGMVIKGEDNTAFASAPVNVGPPRLMAATVSKTSTLIGHAVSDVDFTKTFNAAVLGVVRGKDCMEGGPATVVLQAGDKILLDVAPTFWAQAPSLGDAVTKLHKLPQSGVVQEYLIPMEVKGLLAKALLRGSSVSRVGLKAVVGGFLVGLQRGGMFMSAVADEEELQMGDVLWFAGTASCLALLRKTPGLQVYTDEIRNLKKDPLLDRALVEATISKQSSLIGKTPGEAMFAKAFQAAVLAIRRQGTRVVAPPNSVVLKAGDTLLVEAGDTFTKKLAVENACFATIQHVPNSTPPKLLFVFIGISIFIPCFIAYAVFDLRPITCMMGLAAMLMMLTRCLSPNQAWKAIDWQIIMCIGAAMGVSMAMEKTGGAEAIAKALSNLGNGPTSMIIVIFITTVILSQIVMNTPAAMIVFPVAATLADTYNMDIEIMAYTIMIAASSVYTTPFGDNINLMTFGAGAYSTWEFVRFGIFIQVCTAVTNSTTLVLGNLGKVVYMWIAVGAVALLVLGLPHVFALFEYNRDRKIRKHRQELKARKMERMGTHASKRFTSMAKDVQYEAVPNA